MRPARNRRSIQRATTHRCPGRRCPIYVPMAKLACKTHWFALPEQLRHDLNRTFRRDHRAHLEYFREAVRLLAGTDLTPPQRRRPREESDPTATVAAGRSAAPQLGLFTGEELHLMAKPAIFRQGDVLLIPTDHIPDEARLVPRDNGRIVLAYGEVTGHAHAIADPAADLFALSDSDVDDRFLQITARTGVDVDHEEHSTIRAPKGRYIVRRQREYSPEAVRPVAD